MPKNAWMPGMVVTAAVILWAGAGRQVKTLEGPPSQEVLNMKKIEKSDAEWKKELTPEQFHVMREKGTERPFTGELLGNKSEGLYRCAGCGTELFSSQAKFESGTGWPSFWAPVTPQSIGYEIDRTFMTERVEIHCPVCGAHLGHVFDDGPAPTGKRYCVNSVSLKFAPGRESEIEGALSKKNLETAVFAAGCFWGVEETFRTLKGVKATRVGYTGGRTEKPTYEQVCAGKTGHAEALEVRYDPEEISYAQLLKVFWENHNPTTKNRQGPDHGEQYRSAIFFHTPAQEAEAKRSFKVLESSGKWKSPIVTEITPAATFWEAEAYHQQYAAKRGGKSCHL